MIRRRKKTLALAALAVIVVAAGSGFLFGSGNDGSGIQGRVTGGCVIEDCHPTPKVGLQRVLRWTTGVREGQEFPLVKKFWSAENGTFKVSLPPGRYLVVEDPYSPVEGGMKPLEVTVREGEFTTIYPFYDVGAR